MIGPQLTRIQVAEALVRHSRMHQERVESSLPPGFRPIREIRETGQLVVVAVEKGGLPVEGGEAIYWNFEVRHAIEDLRSALEYCAAEAFARSNGEGSPGYDDVAFPIFGKRADFDGYIKGKFLKLERVYPLAVDAMLVAQPFTDPGRNWWLKELNDLWNEGKHRNPHYFLYLVFPLPDSSGATLLDPKKLGQGLKFALTERLLTEFFRAATDGTLSLVSAVGAALYPSST